MKAFTSAWRNLFTPQSKSSHFRICLFLFLLISFHHKKGLSQETSLILDSHSYGVEDGLSSSVPSWPYMDSQGLIWMGHELGIDRFDGHKVTYFSNLDYFPNLGFFHQIIEDASGEYWILGKAADDREKSVLYLFDFEQKKSQLLIASEEMPFDLGQVLMIEGTKSREHLWVIDAHRVFAAKSIDDVQLLYETHETINAAIANHDSLWLQTEVGFTQLDKQGRILKSIPFKREATNFILGEDSQGNLYHQEIYGDKGQNSIRIYKNDEEWHPDFWKNKRLWAINPIKDQVWLRDYEKGKTQLLSLELELLYEFKDEEITYNDPFYFGFDPKGNAWRNFNGRLFRYSFEPSLFKNYLTDVKVYSGLGYGARGLVAINDSTLIVNGLGGSYLVNHKTGESRFLEEPRSFWGFTTITSLRRLDSKTGPGGKVWMSNETDQILGYDPVQNSYEVVHRKGKKYNESIGHYEESLDLNWALHFDKNGIMWIGQEKGLAYRKPADSVYIEYENYGDYPELELAKITDFLEDENGLWITSSTGLYLMDDEGNLTHRYFKEATNGNVIPFNNLSQVSQGQSNDLWLATIGGGIINLNPTTGKWQQWTTKEGLSHNVTYAVYPDEFGKLWIPSNMGINRFDPASGTFSHYTVQDGLPQNEFNTTSHARLPGGELAFGGINGLTILDPKEFEKISTELRLTPTGLQVQSGKNGEFYNAFASFRENQKIQLASSDIAFVIDFSLLNYMPDNTGQLAYMIEGLDANWNFSKQTNIRFNRLPYGNHLLKVKSQGGNGVWSQVLLIPIQVVRPFYLQWWFFVVVLAVLLALIRVIVLKREKQLRERQLELETQVRQRTEKIEKQADELRSLDKLKSTFFANISHELKTPLTLIAAPIQSVLSDGQLNMSNKEDLLLADRNVKTIQNLITELLDLNRLESGIAQPRYHVINVYQFFKLIYQNFFPKARALNLSYKLQTQVSEGISWALDPVMTEKIVNNLLSNAFKHVEPGGQVIVTIKADHELMVSVSDNGRGISEEDLPHVFDRYFQTNDPQKKAAGGTGIGLALSNELAQVMNGQLQVSSTINKGSIFTLSLPEVYLPDQSVILPDTSSTDQPVAEEKAPLLDIKPKLLLVEDHAEMMQFIRKNLAGLFDIEIAGNGLEAIEKLKGGLKPDLIISDMMMPLMDGMELLRQVRAHAEFKDIPMIFLTAKSAERDKLEAFRLGIDDYLLKPFSMDELKARIKNQLKVSQSKKEGVVLNHSEEKITDIRITKWLASVRLTTEENSGEPDFNLESVAEKLGESKSTFSRKLKRYTGYSPGVYLKEIRLQQARQSLENGVYTRVNDVSRAVGFSSTKYFARQYKERFGKYPSDYLR